MIKVANRILTWLFPKVRGLFSKAWRFLDRVAKRVLKISKSIFEGWSIDKLLGSFSKLIRGKYKSLYYFVISLFSTGSLIAGFFDYMTDLKYDGYISIRRLVMDCKVVLFGLPKEFNVSIDGKEVSPDGENKYYMNVDEGQHILKIVKKTILKIYCLVLFLLKIINIMKMCLLFAESDIICTVLIIRQYFMFQKSILLRL